MTPARVALVLALVISGAVAAWSFLIARGDQSIPITVSALAVMGVCLALLGITLAAGAVRAGNNGYAIRAIGGGLLGGLFMLAAAGTLSAAIVFSLLARG